MRILPFIAVVSIAACASSEAADAPAPKPVNWIVGVDLSSSRDSNAVAAELHLVASLDKTIHNGDRLTIFRVYERGLAGNNDPWVWDVPQSRSPAHPTLSDSITLAKTSRALNAQLPIVFDQSIAGKLNGTDLFATLYRVADIVRGDPGHVHRLLLVSDMLQSTKDVDMERSIPGVDWVQARASAGQIPQLNGVCVAIVGPDVSKAYDHKLHAFWQAYFKAGGADLREDNYRNYMPDVSSVKCE